jgi:hypothetical protein
MAHTCNPSYSGGRDQEESGSKPALANSSERPPSQKNLHKKRASGVAQGIGPEFELQHHTQKRIFVSSWTLLYIPIIPAMREADMGGLLFKASLGQK